MKTIDQQELLIDYAEGLLSSDQRNAVDAMLADSESLREQLALIRSALEHLQQGAEEEAPNHYFTNFLPRVRQKIEGGAQYSHWSMPSFFDMLIRPVMLLMIVVSFWSLYRTLEPEQSPTSIYTLINDFVQEEIPVALEETASFSQNVSESLYELKIDRTSLGYDISHYETENELLTALNEQELEQVVEQLEKKSIQ